MIWNTLKLRITRGPPLAPVDWMQTKKLHSRSSEDRTVSSSSTCNARFIPTIYCTQHLVVVFWKSHSSLLPPCGCTEEEQAVQSASVSILNQKSEIRKALLPSTILHIRGICCGDVGACICCEVFQIQVDRLRWLSSSGFVLHHCPRRFHKLFVLTYI